MITTIRSHIDLIVDKIVTYMDVQSIIVFGSHAYGLPDTESDIDLCIIIPNQPINKRVLIKKIRHLLSDKISYPLDLLVFTQNEFLLRSQNTSTLEYKIANDGVIVYESYTTS